MTNHAGPARIKSRPVEYLAEGERQITGNVTTLACTIVDATMQGERRCESEGGRAKVIERRWGYILPNFSELITFPLLPTRFSYIYLLLLWFLPYIYPSHQDHAPLHNTPVSVELEFFPFAIKI